MDPNLQPIGPNVDPLDPSGSFWAKLPRPTAASPAPKPPTLPSTPLPPSQAQKPMAQPPALFQKPILPTQPGRPQPPVPTQMPAAPPPPPPVGLGPSPLLPSPLPPPSPRAYHIRHGSPGDSDNDSHSSSYDSDGVQPETLPTDPPAKRMTPAEKMTPARATVLGKLATDVIAEADKGMVALLLTVGDKPDARTVRSRVRRDAASAVARHLDVLREVGPLLLKYIGYTPLPAKPRKTADGTATDDADVGEFGLPRTAAAMYRLQIATPGEYLDWLATDLGMRQDATILLSLQTAALGLLLDTLSQAYRDGLNREVHDVRVRALQEALAWIDRTPVDVVLLKLQWPREAGAGHLSAFVRAARKLIPEGAKGDTQVHHHLSDLRAQNFPGIRMYQRSQKWVTDVLVEKEEEYFATLREKGWVMTRSDVDTALKKKLHGVRLGFNGAMNSRIGVVNKRLHGVRSNVDGVKSTLNTKIDSVNNNLNSVKSTVTTKIDGVNTKIEGVNTKIEDVNGTFSTKIDGVNTKIEGVNTKIEGVNTKIEGVNSTVTTKIDNVQSDMHDVKSDMATLKAALAAIAATQPDNAALQLIVSTFKQ